MTEVIPEKIKELHEIMIKACEGFTCEDFIAACYVSAVKVISVQDDCSLLEAANKFSEWIRNEMIPGQEQVLKERHMMQ